MGPKSSKSSPFGLGKRDNTNRHHLETDIACPGCNIVFLKNTSFEVVTI